MVIVIIFSLFIILVVYKIYKATEPNHVQTKEPPKSRELSDAEIEGMHQAEEVWDMTTYFTIQSGEYTGPLPEHVVGGHWTDLYPNIYRTKIAGINFRKGASSYAGQFVDVLLYADEKNEYDTNAIKIITNDYFHIGYIPAEETEAVRQFINNQLPYSAKARIIERSEYDDMSDRERTYLIGNICINKPNKNRE